MGKIPARKLKFKCEKDKVKVPVKKKLKASKRISKSGNRGLKKVVEDATVNQENGQYVKVRSTSQLKEMLGLSEKSEDKESTASVLAHFTTAGLLSLNTDDDGSKGDIKESSNGEIRKISRERTVNDVKKVKKKKQKKKQNAVVEEEEEEYVTFPKIRKSSTLLPRNEGWINTQRVLVLATRGISPRDRHLMKDIRRFLPHSRQESKLERQTNLQIINEICAARHCQKCMLFEGRSSSFSYLWLSNVSGGPSAKFLLQNVHTMDELRFTGNSLLGSRPFLSFNEEFDQVHHYRVIKELLVQIFGVPNHHPKSQPFFDRIYSFSVVDKRIWFRNFQILSEEGALSEIGPRFVMNPVKIFGGSFGGETIWDNPNFVSPVKLKQLVRKSQYGSYVSKQNQKSWDIRKKGLPTYSLPELDEIFSGDPLAKAEAIVSQSSTKPMENGVQEKKKRKKFLKKKEQEVDTEKLGNDKVVSLKRKGMKSKKLNEGKRDDKVKGKSVLKKVNVRERKRKLKGVQ